MARTNIFTIPKNSDIFQDSNGSFFVIHPTRKFMISISDFMDFNHPKNLLPNMLEAYKDIQDGL